VVDDCYVVCGGSAVVVLHDCSYCGSGWFVVGGCFVVTGFSYSVIAEVALWLL
jgi:hypothetical protein